MSDGLIIGLIAQTSALLIFAGTVWSQDRFLRRNLQEQSRNLERQLAAQREQAEIELQHASRQGQEAWVRERHERLSQEALDTAVAAAAAFTRAKADVSAAAIHALDRHAAEELLASSRRHREDLRHAHSRLAMLAPMPADSLIDVRRHLEYFDELAQGQVACFTGGAAAPEWVERNREYRLAEREFYRRMVDHLYDPGPSLPTGSDLSRLRVQVAEGET